MDIEKQVHFQGLMPSVSSLIGLVEVSGMNRKFSVISCGKKARERMDFGVSGVWKEGAVPAGEAESEACYGES